MIYETLCMFGDEEARAAGETVFNQTAAMLREVLKLSRDWGCRARREHHLKGGWIVAVVSYNTGEVIDDRFATVTAGQFTVAAANNYGRGESFARAADWDTTDADVVGRTRDLYETILRHAERLESRIDD